MIFNDLQVFKATRFFIRATVFGVSGFVGLMGKNQYRFEIMRRIRPFISAFLAEIILDLRRLGAIFTANIAENVHLRTTRLAELYLEQGRNP